MDESNLFADYSLEKVYSCSEFTTCKNFTKLMYLIINIKNIADGERIIKEFIKSNKPSINEKNENKWTALHIAVRNSQKLSLNAIVKKLLKNGANINDKINTDYSVLTLAVMYAHTDSNIGTVKLLLDHGVNINEVDNVNTTALITAINYSPSNNNTIVQFLLDHGADVNITNIFGSPLYSACCQTNNIDAIKILIEKGANVNYVNKDSKTALIQAAVSNNFDAIKFLIENGANMNHLCEGKIFLDYLKGDKTLDYVKLISEINHQKLCMKKVLGVMKKYIREFASRPLTITTKTLEINFNIIQGKDYEIIKDKYRIIFDYYGICDNDTLVRKIKNTIAFMD